MHEPCRRSVILTCELLSFLFSSSFSMRKCGKWQTEADAMQKTIVASDKRLEQTKMPLMLSANSLASMMLFSGFSFLGLTLLLFDICSFYSIFRYTFSSNLV